MKVSAVIVKEKSGDREKYIFGTDGNCTAHYVEQGRQSDECGAVRICPVLERNEKTDESAPDSEAGEERNAVSERPGKISRLRRIIQKRRN